MRTALKTDRKEEEGVWGRIHSPRYCPVANSRTGPCQRQLTPIVLQEGIPLFPQGAGELKFRLLGRGAKANGARYLVYAPMA